MLTIVGMGPGPWEQVTPEAKQALEQFRHIYLRTKTHEAVRHLSPRVHVASFDHFYDELPDPETVWQAIVKRVVSLTQDEPEVVYAVPGNPLEGEATAPAIIGCCRDLGLPVRVIPGISVADAVLPALGLDLPPVGLKVVDAQRHGIDPAFPALVAQILNGKVLAYLKTQLEALYPPEHPAMLAPQAGGSVIETKVAKLDAIEIAYPCCLYLTPLAGAERLSEFATLVSIMARLRGPLGCPWDRQQTHASLRPNMLEESYEVLEALDEGKAAKLSEELGDLLMQIVFHAQMAAERGEFQIGDVLRSINAKLLRRHPHIFGQTSVSSAEEVAVNWEEIKRAERGGKGSLLSGIPGELPALEASQSIQRRVAQVGFDWKKLDDVVGKLSEEVAELTKAKTSQEKEEELGDVLFSLVNVGRWLKVDAESALRRANRRFARRFAYMEELCHQRGQSLADMTLDQQNELWDEAKRATSTDV